MSVTCDTSHWLIGPCSLAGLSLPEETPRQSLTARLSSSRDCGENTGDGVRGLFLCCCVFVLFLLVVLARKCGRFRRDRCACLIFLLVAQVVIATCKCQQTQLQPWRTVLGMLHQQILNLCVYMHLCWYIFITFHLRSHRVAFTNLLACYSTRAELFSSHMCLRDICILG